MCERRWTSDFGQWFPHWIHHWRSYWSLLSSADSTDSLNSLLPSVPIRRSWLFFRLHPVFAQIFAGWRTLASPRVAAHWTSLVSFSASSACLIPLTRMVFQATTMSVLLYWCTPGLLRNAGREKKPHSVMNKSWKQYPTKLQLQGHLHLISKTTLLIINFFYLNKGVEFVLKDLHTSIL